LRSFERSSKGSPAGIGGADMMRSGRNEGTVE
jgi:hypothetical protein